MLLLRQFLSELDDTLTQCVSIWSSRIVDPGLMTSLMTSSRIIIVGTLGLNISNNIGVLYVFCAAEFFCFRRVPSSSCLLCFPFIWLSLYSRRYCVVHRWLLWSAYLWVFFDVKFSIVTFANATNAIMLNTAFIDNFCNWLTFTSRQLSKNNCYNT